MKKSLFNILTKLGGCMAVLSLTLTTLTANTTCTWLSYQDELPKEAKNLRKF